MAFEITREWEFLARSRRRGGDPLGNSSTFSSSASSEVSWTRGKYAELCYLPDGILLKKQREESKEYRRSSWYNPLRSYVERFIRSRGMEYAMFSNRLQVTVHYLTCYSLVTNLILRCIFLLTLEDSCVQVNYGTYATSEIILRHSRCILRNHLQRAVERSSLLVTLKIT